MENDPGFPCKYKDSLKIINSSASHLLKLINDVLEISKNESGEQRIIITAFDLYNIIGEVRDMVLVRFNKKNLEFITELSPDLPRYIETDERKLRQILINILGNAVKFTEKGKIVFTVSCEQLSDEQLTDCCLMFTVKDTGPGIDPEETKDLFESFSQAEAGRKKAEGTGLGLAISRQFIELLNGDIRVDSEKGKGSEFKFYIKVKLADITEEPYNLKYHELIVHEPEYKVFPIPLIENHTDSRVITIVADILTELEDAVICLTMDKVNDLIKEIQKHAPDLGNTLAQSADIFDYDEILRIISLYRDKNYNGSR